MPFAVAQTALSFRRFGPFAQAIALLVDSDRETARAAMHLVEQIDGAERPLDLGGLTHAWVPPLVRVAATAGWYDTAETAVGGVFDRNFRAYLSMEFIAAPALASGDSVRAGRLARKVVDLGGRADRPVRAKALAIAVRSLLATDPGGAQEALVAGLVESFQPEVLGLAQLIDPATVDLLCAELGVTLQD